MRDKRIAVSTAEKEKLDQVRQELFGTPSVPYGEVIERLAEKELEDE